MENRDLSLIEIRPVIGNVKTKCINDSESFQNNTLRPILKLQNDLSVDVFKSSRKYHEIISSFNEPNQFALKTRNLINKDTKLRDKLVSIIIALFTIEEYHFYKKNKKELNKRIINMQIERIIDNLKISFEII